MKSQLIGYPRNLRKISCRRANVTLALRLSSAHLQRVRKKDFPLQQEKLSSLTTRLIQPVFKTGRRLINSLLLNRLETGTYLGGI
jgi:hypothetical protein